MGSEWREIEIGKYVKVQGGYAFKGTDFIENGIPVAKIKNVKERVIDLSDCGFVNDEVANASANFFVKNGDVLISMTGSGANAPNSIVGRVARHSGSDNAFLINQRVGRFLIENDSQIYNRYLYYYLSPKERQWEFVAVATGSANQVNISGKQIESFPIKLPPLSEQKAIAHILGSLDDKIELNRQMNQTLEAMAQALFKSWFVDFDPVLDNALVAGNVIPEELQARAARRAEVQDASSQRLPQGIQELFPSEFEFSEELGKFVPCGWRVETINEGTSLIIDHRGKTPKKLGGDWSLEGYPAISAKNIKRREIINHSQIRYLNSELYHKWMKEELEEGDMLMTSEAPMGETYFLARDKKYCLSQRMYALRCSKELSPSYLYCWMHTDIANSDMDARATGTTVTGIKQSELRKVKVLFPQEVVVNIFEKEVRPILNKNFDTQVEIQSLTNLRDTLLPKLISGEVRV